jgi:hypothetical protein
MEMSEAGFGGTPPGRDSRKQISPGKEADASVTTELRKHRADRSYFGELICLGISICSSVRVNST